MRFVSAVLLAILLLGTVLRWFNTIPRLRRGSFDPEVSASDTLVVCRFCHQQVRGRAAYRRSCDTCFTAVSKRDEDTMTTLREDPPPLFEDLVSQAFQPGHAFVRVDAPLVQAFGPDRPSESHTHSLREFMQYPTLHRERFLTAVLAEISAPATLLEESLDAGGFRIRLANPDSTYRAHRPRSLGAPGVRRMDCYVVPAAAVSDDDPNESGDSYVLTIVNYVFATVSDVAVLSSAHKSAVEAKQAACQYLHKRYREVPPAHTYLASTLLADSALDSFDADKPLQDLKSIGAVVVGPQKATWLPELSSVWDGTLHQLLGYVDECESRTQVLLLIGMLPDWQLSRKRLIKTVMALSPVPEEEGEPADNGTDP